MHLLPSEQKQRIDEAIKQYNEIGQLTIHEPCNCGSRILHNNGGNYHEIIFLHKDEGKDFVKYETTCEMVPEAEWESCEDPEAIIKENADWL